MTNKKEIELADDLLLELLLMRAIVTITSEDKKEKESDNEKVAM
jgi:hypothetical protein